MTPDQSRYHDNILVMAFIGAEARRMQRTPEEWDARDLLLARGRAILIRLRRRK